MKLSLPFFNKPKQEESEYYLALLLTDEKASAVILKQLAGKLQIIGGHEEFFSSSLELTEVDELIRLIDKTISTAEEVLPPDIQTHKTVFGLKESWIDKDTKKIKKEYLAKLKKACDSLDLSPMGFMVITEAISNLLQDEEGVPLSAILAEVGKKTVALTLFRGGKITEQVDGPIGGSAPETVDNLLKHFTASVLPARIILYDAKDSDKLSQSFISHKWSKSLPFLHVPQITVLPDGTDARAVVFGAAEQMGFEVLGMDSKDSGTTPIHMPTSDETTEASAVSPDNFGFVVNQDIAETTPQEKNISQEDKSFDVNFPQKDSQESQESFEENTTMEEKYAKTRLTKVLSIFSSIRLPKIFSPYGQNKNNYLVFLIAVVVGVIILMAGVSYFYLAKVKANIILSVKPKMVDETTTIIFSSTSPSDFSKNIIATQNVETAVKGDMTIDTTGKKDIGDKAKGKVTIYNNDNNSVKLNSGDNIKSSSGLIFTLDKDISISSASGDIFSGTKPGTADVNVTAKEIGTDYNLPSGTKFTVGTSSTLAAKNDSAFSGGSKKQVQVVSKNDVEKLKLELPKSLESKAHSQIAEKAGKNEKVLPLVLTVGLDNQKFDKDVGEEAKKVKLTANVKFLSLSYQEDELIGYVKSILKNKYSESISFADGSIKSEIKDAKDKKNKQVEATLIITAGLLPNINKDEIVQKAKEQSLKKTKEMLSQLPQVEDAQIKFSPPVLFLPSLFPKLPNQVNIEIHPE